MLIENLRMWERVHITNKGQNKSRDRYQTSTTKHSQVVETKETEEALIEVTVGDKTKEPKAETDTLTEVAAGNETKETKAETNIKTVRTRTLQVKETKETETGTNIFSRNLAKLNSFLARGRRVPFLILFSFSSWGGTGGTARCTASGRSSRPTQGAR